ncbi:MAG: hydrogenase expression/formation protein HypE [Bacteroidales bacterium]|jgi:hydrogenase expression/formation protein HypE|nr:hydrogenase expression/formation protein HypE [Bacteroidales bacterium]
MDEIITLNQGSGGRQTLKLIDGVFRKYFGMPEPLTDSAIIKDAGGTITFTTDSYVVDPIFFPGGNIGRLAICGTVNDLAVSGAVPKYISAAFIIEEGLPLKDLIAIVESMAGEAEKAGVRIVTGDTKVVEKGKCDKLFITTSGTGILDPSREHISRGEKIKQGDKIIINGPVGNHALAVLGARNKLSFTTPVVSDCASLNGLTGRIMEESKGILFMRDLTRGGLAAVLNELAGMIRMGIRIDEASVPVDEPVRGICEMLGFDPLYLANEGKLIVVTESSEAQKVLDIMRSVTSGKKAAIIGEVILDKKNLVTLDTSVGGKRILDMPSGTQLPRIC